MYVGLFGYVGETGIIRGLTLDSADVIGSSYTGQLVGHSGGIVDDCHSSGVVVGTDSVGGLIGRFWKTNDLSIVKNSSSSTKVNGNDFGGGLIGWARGPIHNSSASGDVTISGNRSGGLIGIVHPGEILNSHASGDVTGGYLTGGLVGGIEGSVASSYSTGKVKSGSWSGGLIGVLGAGTGTGSVVNSFSTSVVIGGDESIGGLVGYAYANFRIENSYFAGSVSGGSYVGGLAGITEDTSINSYSSASSVTGTNFVGGLHGYVAIEPVGSFWDKTISNLNITFGVSGEKETENGLSTEQMKSSDKFKDWDEFVWNITEGEYPILRN